MIVSFDIETGPNEMIGEEGLLLIRPFDQGRLKDPEKIEAARVKHIEKFTLQPTTGELLTICLGVDGHEVLETRWEYTEVELMSRFWEFVESQIIKGSVNLAGWYCNGFDIPFLVGRSLLLGVDLPSKLFNGRYYHRRIHDVSKKWDCFQYGAYTKLEEVARAFGLGEKPGEGKHFYHYFRDDPKRAIEYAKWDARVTLEIAKRVLFAGVV